MMFCLLLNYVDVLIRAHTWVIGRKFDGKKIERKSMGDCHPAVSMVYTARKMLTIGNAGYIISDGMADPFL